MEELKGFQKKYLRGLAHSLEPVVIVGQKGLTPSLTRSVTEALAAHELIKVKYNDFKEKEQKTAISDAIAASCDCHLVGTIGHTAIFYRPQPDPEKRKILLPAR